MLIPSEHLDASSGFAALESKPADALLKLIGLHRDDPRPDKIDVGVGVYRDVTGGTPIMAAVKTAERQLWERQHSKSYLGPEGDRPFVDLLARIVFGAARLPRGHLTGVQTPGGTGALRLAAELVARARCRGTIWIGTPSWPNHAPIFRDAGLIVREHPFYDYRTRALDFAGMVGQLEGASPGDILLLHGCCHNPTGVSLDLAQWDILIDRINAGGLLPIVDLAYQGLGRGLDADAAGLRKLVAEVPNALIAYSCDKNFALYRERVGALWVHSRNPTQIAVVRQNLLVLARHLWSMPPDHGAAVVRLILEDPELEQIWREELIDMQTRLQGLRRALASSHAALAPLATQEGMFALLPLGSDAIHKLRSDHGIYMADDGRINIAGLRDETVIPFASAVAPYLPTP